MRLTAPFLFSASIFDQLREVRFGTTAFDFRLLNFL